MSFDRFMSISGRWIQLWNRYLQGAYHGWRLSQNNYAAHNNIWNLMLPRCFCWPSVCDTAQAKALMQGWFGVVLLLFLFFFSFLIHEWFHCRDLSKIDFLCWYISDFILGIWVRFAFYIDTHDHLYNVYNFLMSSGTWTPFNPETVRLMIGKNCVDCREHLSFAKEVWHHANFRKIDY